MIGDLFALVLAVLFAYYLITKHLLSRKCRVWTVLNNVASKPHSSEDLGVEDDSDFGRAVKFVRCGKFRLQDASVIVIFILFTIQKLALYGLFKQATIGDVNIENPGALDFVGSAKWSSWKSYEGLSKEYVKRDLYFVEMQKRNM